MNRRNLPLILMLIAGAVTCIINLIRNYSTLVQLSTLLVVFVVFNFLGSVLKWTLDYFDSQNEKAEQQEEGEVAKEDSESTEGESA